MTANRPALAPSLRSQPLSIGLRLAYCVGTAPDAMVNATLNVFLLYYLTSICGLSPALAGFAVAAGLVVDAVVDPWIGMRSDHLKSRWGRRLPFMLGAIPVMTGAFATLFALPSIDNAFWLFAIVLLLCVAVRVGLSAFGLPFLAVGAELSDDDDERARIITWRWATGMILATATVVLGFGVFFKGEHGIAQAQQYPRFALVLAALMLAMTSLASLAVYRTLGRQHPPPAQQAGSLRQLLRELRQLFRSPTFSTIFLACLLASTAQSTTQSLSLHAYTFFWKLGGEQTQMAIIAMTLGLIFGAPIGGWLVRRWEHRTTISFGVLGVMLAQIIPPSLKLCGLLTAEAATLGAILAGAQLLAGMMLTIAMLALLSMNTDALDEHEYQYGVRIEALYFAGWILAGKAANGLGAFLSGLALQAIDFPAQAAAGGAATAIPEYTVRLLGVIYGPGVAIFGAATLAVLSRYPLNRDKHRQIMSALQQRKDADAQRETLAMPLQTRVAQGL